MSKEQTNVAHFSINGAYIVDIARERLLDGDPNYAYTLLKDGLDGISHEQVIDILKGNQTLVGVNDIEIVADNDVAYKAKIERMTTGIYRHKGKLYQPHGYVEAYTEIDFRFANDKKSAPQKSEEFSRFRNEYYCGPDEIVVRVPEFYTPDGFVTREYAIFKEVNLVVGMARDTINEAEAFKAFYPKYNLLGIIDEDYLEEVNSRKSYKQAEVKPLTDQEKLEQIQNEEERYRLEDESFQRQLNGYKKIILDQVEKGGHGFIELKAIDGAVLAKVAYAPFVNWCVDRHLRIDRKSFLPEWKNVSAHGLKMQNDDPAHTDWMLSGNLPLNDWFDNESLKESAYRKMGEIQETLFNMKSLVLSSGNKNGYAHGTVVLVEDKNQKIKEGSIVVLKNATPEFELQMVQATKNGNGGVIVAVGSSVAHLAKIGRESGVMMMRMEDAFEKLHDGDIVSMDSNSGEIHIGGYDFEAAEEIKSNKELLASNKKLDGNSKKTKLKR